MLQTENFLFKIKPHSVLKKNCLNVPTYMIARDLEDLLLCELVLLGARDLKN